MPNIAAVTFGFSIRLSSTEAGNVPGRKRSTGEPGASATGSLPMIRREIARGGVRVGLAGRSWGFSAGKLCLRLRDVGPGDLADVEAVAGLLQRLFEHPHVALLNLDDGGIAQVVHVDRSRRQQHRLLENPQGFPGARDLSLRGTGSVGGLLAVENRLRDREAGAARSVRTVNFRPDDRRRRDARRG